MNNFEHYTTPEDAFKFAQENGDPTTLEDYREMASADGTCECCERESIWRYAGTGMCFTCTTGESDASEDYELTPGDES